MNSFVFEPISFFAQLGGLHDSEISRFMWDATTRAVALDIDDLNANFDGLPEYLGRRRVSIKFTQVENILLNCDALKNDAQRIYKLVIQKKSAAEKYELKLRISPSGQLSFDFQTVCVLDLA